MFTHLHVHSSFSFLDGVPTPEDLVQAAAAEGMSALALTDHNRVSGAVRFTRAAAAHGLKPIIGTELSLHEGHITLLADGPRGYRSLCRLLSAAHLGSERGHPTLPLMALAGETEGLVVLSGCRSGVLARPLWRHDFALARERAQFLQTLFGKRFFLELQRCELPGDRALESALCELSETLSIPIVATQNVHYLKREQFWLHDLLTCVRVKATIETPHRERRLNAENALFASAQMHERFADHPEWLRRAQAIADAIEPAFELGRKRYPRLKTTPAEADATLRRLVLEGAARRYGVLSAALSQRLEDELAVITALGFADYFLIAWDIGRFAKERGIRMAGRGSAADSVIAYCLGLTEVDSFARGLLFERFVSRERAECPDIDLDFDHRRRDEVAAYVYHRYGSERVAAVATFQTYLARSAVRDLGKALGLSDAQIDRLARHLPMMAADSIREALVRLPELRALQIPARHLDLLLDAAAQLAGHPRFIGTHLGGLVLAAEPLDTIAPREMSAKGVEIVGFDKDDVEALGLMKMDLLSLRTLAVLEESYRAVPEAESTHFDDAATFARIQRGETIGVFQLESPAQRALQPRLDASQLDDLVHAVAIIRPGPIQGNMVDPYLKRRRGEEPITYLHPKLEPILRKTYGVVLFQEQVIAIATEVAGMTPGEADQLRRVMTHARSRKEMERIGISFCERAQRAGIEPDTAQKIFAMLAGYASYGFPEAHAAAFAQTAYRTAELSEHHPAAFFAALLSLQPMGYYPPHVLVFEAKRRGVAFRPISVQKSDAAFTVEGGAIRVGLSALRGLGSIAAERIVASRPEGGYWSCDELWSRTKLDRRQRQALALCGALDDLDTNRRRQYIAANHDPRTHGLFSGSQVEIEDFPEPRRSLLQEDVLPLGGPGTVMAFLRPWLRERGLLRVADVTDAADNAAVSVAGMLLQPHRPPTRSGRTVVFASLQDETGLCDVHLFEDIYQRYGALVFTERPQPLLVHGRLQNRGGARSLEVRSLTPLRRRVR